MWKIALENAKLVAGTIMVLASLAVGSWTLVTDIFATKAYAEELVIEQKALINKLDLDTSYNKAFRLDEKIERYKRLQRPLTRDEDKTLKRYKKDLNRTELHIDVLEQKIYNPIKKDKE